MDIPPRNASHSPYINCQTGGLSVVLASMPDHVYSTLTPAISPHISPPSTFAMPLLQQRDEHVLRPLRPALPKIDSSVSFSVPLAGELTPASSNVSPVSAKSASLKIPRSAPPRRIPKFAPQGPPSPELVNLDCAFPPFPGIAKDSKKDDKSKSHGDKHARRRPASPASSSGSSRHWPRAAPSRRESSASSKQPLKLPTTGTLTERPPTGVSRKQRPVSTNAEDAAPMLSTSAEGVPQVPTLGLSGREDKGPVQLPTSATSRREMQSWQPPITSTNVLYDEPQPIEVVVGKKAQEERVEKATNAFPMARPRKDSVPSYKSKQPPPIISNIAFVPRMTPLRSATMPEASSVRDVSLNLSRIPGQRRSQSISAIEGDLVGTELSDEPKPVPALSFALSTPGTSDQTPITPLSLADSAAPAILLSSALAASSRRETDQPGAMEFAEGGKPVSRPPVISESVVKVEEENKILQLGSAWKEGQSALTSDPGTSNSIARRPSDLEMDRNSVDSASSYGSFDGQTASSSSSVPAAEEMEQKLGDLLHPEPAQPAVEMLLLQPTSPGPTCDSPTDPLFINGRLTPIPSEMPKEIEAATVAPTVASEVVAKQHRPRRPARKDSLAQSKKPAAGSKGICRGCSRPILAGEKSVVSADGRLTGRYHKECLVCSTCKSAFSTAEFYVHADRPYCGHHYHELEDSLCATCGKGIEGLYMETANVAGRGREKHHAKCLKCARCRVQLTEDYFELSGKVYCERDAFRMASAAWTQDNRAPSRSSPLVREYISSGEPKAMQKGTNFPERMITKVMTAT
ncbi:hypothetical protein DV736_g5377, partial [Chaetothyriales sp. CBS 134916]